VAEAAGFGSANIEDFGLNNSKFPGVISELDGVQLYIPERSVPEPCEGNERVGARDDAPPKF